MKKMTTIRAALNGYGVEVTFGGKPIYYEHEDKESLPFSLLGKKEDKVYWIKENLRQEFDNENTIYNINNGLLVDWNLYENGWLITINQDTNDYKDNRLMFYKCQIGSTRYPRELEQFRLF